LHTEIYTYFTVADGVSKLLFSANFWCTTKLTLETAGPVAAGTREDVVPVLSGKGILLTTLVEEEWVLAKGDRIFIAAESINRVKFIVEPLPSGDIRDMLEADRMTGITATQALEGTPGL
jgi:hypothetical protein